MSALLVSEVRTPAPVLEPRRDEPTLDSLIVGAWTELASHRTVVCPVCSARMRPLYGQHALPLGGQCGECGSTLR